jgi:hypothetical protein
MFTMAKVDTKFNKDLSDNSEFEMWKRQKDKRPRW